MTPARKLVRRMWMGYVPNGAELEMLDAALVAAERAPQGAPLCHVCKTNHHPAIHCHESGAF